MIREQLEVEKKQLLSDVDAERSHHQKMLKDYNRLQQRYENLQDEIEIMQSPTASPIKGSRKDNGKQIFIAIWLCSM